MKTVGVIGGLGPETTSEFYLDIIFSSYELNKEQRPGIIISSVPLPYKIEEEVITKNKGIERCIPFLTSEAKRLEKAGADFIVMPCNTLHVFINELRNSVSIPVLSIIEETIKFIKKKNFTKIGIIATPAAIKNGLYQDAFEDNGVNYITPNDSQQTKMGKIILNLVKGGENKEDKKELNKVIKSLEEKNVDCVLLACTDLQLLKPTHSGLEIFDTMKIFSDATVEKILE